MTHFVAHALQLALLTNVVSLQVWSICASYGMAVLVGVAPAVVIMPRSSAANNDVYACCAAALRAAAHAAAGVVRVAAAVHRGVVRLEADWLWEASASSTIRILPTGAAVGEVNTLLFPSLAIGHWQGIGTHAPARSVLALRVQRCTQYCGS